MEKQEYDITIHSRTRFSIFFIIVFLSFSLLQDKYVVHIENKFLSFLFFMLLFVSSFLISSILATARIKVILSNDSIVHIWKRRFFLSRERDIKINWTLIENYKFESYRKFYSLIINLSNKTQYRIERLNILPIDDDFRKLENELAKRLNQYTH